MTEKNELTEDQKVFKFREDGEPAPTSIAERNADYRRADTCDACSEAPKSVQFDPRCVYPENDGYGPRRGD